MPFRGSKATIDSATDDGEQSRTMELILNGLGILMAIPLLHVILWWFVGIDPLGLSRPATSVVPFLVPNEMKVRHLADDAQEQENLSPTKNSIESSSQEEAADSALYDERFEIPSADGKLPTPNLDPATVQPSNR